MIPTSQASESPATLAASAHVRAFETELVVLGPFGLVAENVVSFLDFLETRFGLFVAGIAIGMKLARQASIGFF